jgi:hypothetical protein
VADSEYPIDPIDFSAPGDAEKVMAIEWWSEAGQGIATVEFTDGEIESLPMSKAEARAKADRCFGYDEIIETSKNGLSYRWSRMPRSS